MALSKSTRIIILLVIDSAFFLLELITGYAVHSLALVADSFHMLNDVLSLCVGLWAVKMAGKSSEQTPKMYTYGYQRAETLGALVNGVFLVALCVTIFLDAIQRFVEPQEVTQPVLILVVGCLGLASNLVGLVLFHDHGHSHGGHSHGHSHAGHSHGDEVRNAEEGHSHADHSHEHSHGEEEHSHGNGHAHAHKHAGGPSADAVFSPKSGKSVRYAEPDHSDTTVADESSEQPPRTRRRHSRSTSRGVDFEGPKSFRNSIVQAASQLEDLESDAEAETALANDESEETANHETTSPLLGSAQGGYGSIQKAFDHKSHRHAQERPKGSSGGHSHGDLNMRGIFLHVMGDALGNVGVIATALFIWLTDYSWRFYFDPAISLVITVIILCSAIPLCQAASRILLQAVPHGIEVDDIKYDIEDLDGVESCHHLHVWQLSDEKLIASLHVKVNFNFKGDGSAKYMELAKEIRQCLHEYGIHSSTIQPEFSSFDLDSRPIDAARDQLDVASITQRSNSEAGDPSCLLDCGDACEGSKSCCPPAAAPAAQQSNDGHNH